MDFERNAKNRNHSWRFSSAFWWAAMGGVIVSVTAEWLNWLAHDQAMVANALALWVMFLGGIAMAWFPGNFFLTTRDFTMGCGCHYWRFCFIP